MNKTYKIQLPRNKEAQNIKTNIKDGTIEVEVELKEKWEPKDGDVCFISARYNHLIIFRKFKNDIISSYVNTTFAYDQTDESGTDICDIKDVVEFRPATDLERLELFHKMMKKGKMWDAENRKVVDYPMWDKKGDVKNSKE